MPMTLLAISAIHPWWRFTNKNHVPGVAQWKRLHLPGCSRKHQRRRLFRPAGKNSNVHSFWAL